MLLPFEAVSYKENLRVRSMAEGPSARRVQVRKHPFLFWVRSQLLVSVRRVLKRKHPLGKGSMVAIRAVVSLLLREEGIPFIFRVEGIPFFQDFFQRSIPKEKGCFFSLVGSIP